MIIQSRAPNRILDFGGWSDTHFAQSGNVLNMAVNLYANVTIKTSPRPGVMIRIQDFGEELYFKDIAKIEYNSHHDLLKAALKTMNIEGGYEVAISADVPPGCGTGSSAAISVALLNALSVLSGRFLSPHEIAHFAHRLETDELGFECGIQDQYAAAFGGINFIEMPEYPMAHVSPITLPRDLIAALESQLLVVYEGKGHLSSEVHRKVIENLGNPESTTAQSLNSLKETAKVAQRAMRTSDCNLLAEVMNLNNNLQKSLHPGITTERLEKIEAIGRSNGAQGAMINGAGGGGSICLLCAPGRRVDVAIALKKEGFKILPMTICKNPSEAWVVKP